MPRRSSRGTPSVTEEALQADGVFHSEWLARLPPAELRPGTLYVVSTPFGDVEDVSIRALRVLMGVCVVVAETPALTRRLLSHYGIDAHILGFRGRQSSVATAAVLDRLRAGGTAALVCDAGTPRVSDVGASVVRAALSAGVSVTAVPGCCAALAALVLANLSAERFAFDGVPPRERTGRLGFFASLAPERRAILLYETRRYLRDTLNRLCTALGGDRAVLVARDLSTPSESLYYGTLADSVDLFRHPPAGRYTLVISGLP